MSVVFSIIFRRGATSAVVFFTHFPSRWASVLAPFAVLLVEADVSRLLRIFRPDRRPSSSSSSSSLSGIFVKMCASSFRIFFVEMDVRGLFSFVEMSVRGLCCVFSVDMLVRRRLFIVFSSRWASVVVVSFAFLFLLRCSSVVFSLFSLYGHPYFCFFSQS